MIDNAACRRDISEEAIIALQNRHLAGRVLPSFPDGSQAGGTED